MRGADVDRTGPETAERPGDVSVIIPTYNRAEAVLESVRSCLDVRGAVLQVIVVDDGSSDGTADVLRDRFGEGGVEHAVDGHRVLWVSVENGGAPAARNRGIALAKAEFCKFLDSDDLLIPAAVPAEVAEMREKGLQMLVTGWQVVTDGEGGRPPVTAHVPAPRMGAGIDDMLRGQAPITTAALYCRRFIERIIWNPDRKKAQDWEWAWDVVLQEPRIGSLELESYVHDERGNDRIGQRSDAARLSSLERNSILLKVEQALEKSGRLTDERRRLLSQYLYKGRLEMCEISPRKWSELWEHCRRVDPSGTPQEYIRLIRWASAFLGRYYGVLSYVFAKRVYKNALWRSGSAA